jgi:hypothetical protein
MVLDVPNATRWTRIFNRMPFGENDCRLAINNIAFVSISFWRYKTPVFILGFVRDLNSVQRRVGKGPRRLSQGRLRETLWPPTSLKNKTRRAGRSENVANLKGKGKLCFPDTVRNEVK